MAQEFTMPKLGLTMTDGTIREWLVADGTFVNAGDPVLIIETDKVETEVEARESGYFTATGEVGENYECGAVIGMLGAEGESTATSAPASAPAETAAAATSAEHETAPAPAPATTAAAPAAAETAAVAAPVSAGPVRDIATRGEGGRILASPRARAAARDVDIDLFGIAGTGPNGRIVYDDVQAFVAHQATQPPSQNGAARGEGGRILASPRARAAARESNVDLAGVAGTGPDGRIVHDDVQAFVAHQAAQPATQEAAIAAPTPAPAAPTPAPAALAGAAPRVAAGQSALATGGARILAELLGIDLAVVPVAAGSRITREDVATYVRSQLAGPASSAEPAPTEAAPLLQEPTSVVPLRGMRGVIAERMHASLHEMAQLTLSIDAEMTAINTERDRLKRAGETVPGYTAWVVAAASRALVDHPYVNSQVTNDGVAYLPRINLGVAVALDDGLIVPVVTDSNQRRVDELHSVVADLAGRARNGKLSLDELQGGTFSVTALGMYGVDMFTPVINPPNSAILGVGRLRTDTIWADGQPAPRTMMTLSLTWDHRAFDGAPAAEFAQSIVRYLENPAELGV